jgi:DNA-binding protein Fis
VKAQRTKARTANKRKSRRPVRGSVPKYHAVRAWLRWFKRLPTMFEWEYLLVDEAMNRYQNKTHAAAAVGLTREGFRKKLIRMGIS